MLIACLWRQLCHYFLWPSIASPVSKTGASRRVTTSKRRLTDRASWHVLVRTSLWGVKIAFLAVPVVAIVMLSSWVNQPIQQVSVDGELKYVERADIQRVLQQQVAADFFDLDLKQTAMHVTALPWVKQAVIQRQWPNRISAHITEHLPIARWGDEGYLSQNGTAIIAPMLDSLASLPSVYSASLDPASALAFYREMSAGFSSIGLQITALEQQTGQGWILQTKQGFSVRLGRQDMAQRMRRVLVVLNKLDEQQQQTLMYLDARYSNAVAAGWKDTRDLDKFSQISNDAMTETLVGTWGMNAQTSNKMMFAKQNNGEDT